MFYVLLGKTCSGKTTLLNKIESNTLIWKEVSLTTRPRRKGEINGKDYYFLSELVFDKLSKNGRLICEREFKNAFGGIWKYALDTKFLFCGPNKALILDPQGYRELKKAYPGKVKGIYLDIDNEVLTARGSSRGDDPKELERRLKADDIDFSGIKEDVHLVISTTDLDEQITIFLNFVDGHE